MLIEYSYGAAENALSIILLDDLSAYDYHSWCHGDETSERVYDHLDAVTESEMARYYQKIKQILNHNSAFLDDMIEQLVDKKILSYKERKDVKSYL